MDVSRSHFLFLFCVVGCFSLISINLGGHTYYRNTIACPEWCRNSETRYEAVSKTVTPYRNWSDTIRVAYNYGFNKHSQVPLHTNCDYKHAYKNAHFPTRTAHARTATSTSFCRITHARI